MMPGMGISGADLEGMPSMKSRWHRTEAIILSMTVAGKTESEALKSEQKAQDRKGRRRGHRSSKPLHQAV